MRILILGASGMLGHKLWQQLRLRYAETYATLRVPKAAFARCGLFDDERVIDNVDAASFAVVQRVLGRMRPDAIINCVAVTKRREISTDALSSIELNAALPHRLANWAAQHASRVIHFSTDCVFDGRRGGYSEGDPTDAVDLYGRTKALGEVGAPGALTLRTSFIGREIIRGTELLEWFLAQRDRRIKGYRNALYTGVSTLWMAQLVGDLLERWRQLHGLYQVAAPMISKFDLLRLARNAYNLPVDIEADDDTVVRRNLDGSLFTRVTGIEVPGWPQMMSELAADPTPYERWSKPDAA
jgi:dTDP-4-dehydrorhamnose reductase